MIQSLVLFIVIHINKSINNCIMKNILRNLTEEELTKVFGGAKVIYYILDGKVYAVRIA